MPDLVVSKTKVPLRRGSEYYITYKGVEHAFPSVTNILGDSIPKPQLVNWAARTAAQAALNDPGLSLEKAAGSIYGTKYKAADKGTFIHGWAEEYLRGNEPSMANVPEDYMNYAIAVKEFFEDEKPKVGFIGDFPLIEFTVFSIKHRYAGTSDFATFSDDGSLNIFDWKTGKGVYAEAHLQQLAYLNADYIFDRKTGKILPMPEIKGKCYLVHLRNDGGYSKVKVRGNFDTFLHFRKTYDILKTLGKD